MQSAETLVTSIHLWGSTFANGVQLAYANHTTSEAHVGTHDQPQCHTMNLQPGEYISLCRIRNGNIMDNITIETNQGRTLSVGSNGGGEHVFSFNNRAIVGFHGGVGGHVHNIGVYTLPLGATDLVFCWCFSY
eukprot:TRINITY_DN2617_c0_g1_i1.p2 TRINITY_DN2617_c0_g1~~TRINITY_DN2617_c0_g1_i1.p2  ORF type:complete len:146 (+),score=5.66 TRINITY_DN2617_c0_g1_i1:42-440(+)